MAATDPDLRRRLLALADRIDGARSLPEIEPEVRGHPGAATVTIGGGAYLTLSGEVSRISKDLRDIAAELRRL